MFYSLLNVKKEEPKIITLSEPLKMVGVSIRTHAKSIYKDAQVVGKQYQMVKKAGIIQHKKEPWGFVAVSKNFSEDGGWDYLLGDIVTDFEIIPKGLACFEIPARTYARFSLQPRAVMFWGIALGLLKRYIYTEWLPNSGYATDSALIGDFEYHDQRSISKRPEIDLYVSIKKKVG